MGKGSSSWKRKQARAGQDIRTPGTQANRMGLGHLGRPGSEVRQQGSPGRPAQGMRLSQSLQAAVTKYRGLGS